MSTAQAVQEALSTWSWFDHNGKTVKVDGKAYKINVRGYEVIYPYKHTTLYVDAELVNKKCREYVETKAKLGDDWSTDVLQSDPEFQGKIMIQLDPRLSL